MDVILANLRDPAWWFTAVFIGILVSIAAAYLRDWLIHLTSYAPKKYKAWREQQMQKENVFIELLASDSTRLIIANIKVARLFISFAVLILSFIVIESFTLFSAFSSSLNTFPLFSSLNAFSLLFFFLGLMFGVSSIFVSYGTVIRQGQVNRANRLYHARAHGTPHIQQPLDGNLNN